jgi:tRNA nucleotidyltransferase (CCA-adding enzyme)
MQIYLVGGAVRDEIMGVKSKDLDYSVVLDPVEGDPFRAMVNRLKMQGFKVFLETPQHLTVRAQFPNGDVRGKGGMTADFVLARKEGDYTDGRRPDKVEPGTLMDDLARRDFTMNAMAKGRSEKGDREVIIDPFDGERDIEHGIIRTVGSAAERFSEDALRVVRALRFSVTKGFVIHPDTAAFMQRRDILDSIENKISDERIDIELRKMFEFDTVASLVALNQYPALTRSLFSGTVRLTSTMKRAKGK